MGYYKSIKNRLESVNQPDEDNDDFFKSDEVPEDDQNDHHPFILYLKRTRLKALQGESIYNVGKYFFRSMFMENLSTRASSLSFNFFLALFPALIFLLTLIGYLPLYGLKSQFIQELSRVLPKQTFREIQETILEILNKQNSGLLSFGFITTIYFASNAFHLLINSFNRRLPFAKKKNWFQIRGKAIFMTFWISILIIAALLLLTWAYQSVTYITNHDWPFASVYAFVILLIEYLILAALFQIGISSIYYFGPSNTKRWRFLSAGSITATVLGGISTLAFGMYVNNFNTYNKVYGSIGAIIALMILIYINVLTIIVGFELNVSIEKALIQKERKSNSDTIQ
jgi:membrane protein